MPASRRDCVSGIDVGVEEVEDDRMDATGEGQKEEKENGRIGRIDSIGSVAKDGMGELVRESRKGSFD